MGCIAPRRRKPEPTKIVIIRCAENGACAKPLLFVNIPMKKNKPRGKFRRSANDAPGDSDLGKPERAVQEAIAIFESQPGFVDNQLWLRNQMENAAREAPAESQDFGTAARAELALSWFEIRVEAFARLVRNIRTQNVLIAMFSEFERAAWMDFLGDYPECVRAVSEPARWLADQISKSRDRWVRKGYEQIAAAHQGLRVGSHGDDRCGRSAAKWEDIDITFTARKEFRSE